MNLVWLKWYFVPHGGVCMIGIKMIQPLAYRSLYSHGQVLFTIGWLHFVCSTDKLTCLHCLGCVSTGESVKAKVNPNENLLQIMRRQRKDLLIGLSSTQFRHSTFGGGAFCPSKLALERSLEVCSWFTSHISKTITKTKSKTTNRLRP